MCVFFQLVAPDHPARHQTNQLISNFAFRVFTFQGMTSGDRLQISARVTGCVEAIDCAPVSISPPPPHLTHILK